MTTAHVLQSGPVTPGHLVVWSTDGVVQDGGPPYPLPVTTPSIVGENLGSFTNTGPQYPFLFSVGGASPTTILNRPPGATYNEDAVSGAIAAPAGSTQYVVNGVAGYASSAAAATQVVGGYFLGICGASGVYAWGINPDVDDRGFASPELQSIEADFTSSNGATSGNVVSLNAQLVARTSGNVNGIVAGKPSGGGTYASVFVSSDGAGTNGVVVGSLTTTANSNGQVIALNARDSTNTVQPAVIYALSESAGSSIYMAGSGSGSRLVPNMPVKLIGYTVAAGPSQLPSATSALEGAIAYVVDFSGSPTYMGAVGSGGGTTVVKVFCNGAAWLTA